MFFGKGKNTGRLVIFKAVLLVTFLLFIFEFFKTSVLSHSYYLKLSEDNRVKEEVLLAPRGVFYDREGRLLATNQQDEKHGFLRRYLYPQATAHLLGYMGLPSTVNLQDYSCGSPPLPYQMVGTVALEKYYECVLRGKPGKVLYEVNASGEKVAELAKKEPQQGQNIQLSILLRLQEIADRAFQGKKGAAIATDPKTGEVLLFYSAPSFNSNVFLQKDTSAYKNLVKDETEPLFNRLTLGRYPPGSVVKPIIALAALEEGVISKDSIYEDTGVLELGGVKFGNWYFLQYGKKEGMVDVVKAIARSNDIFFYQVGMKLGIDRLKHWLQTFSLDAQDLSRIFPQTTAVVPDEAWKKGELGQEWYLGDTINLSIGQGYLMLNPAQLHMGVSIIASGGKKCDFIFAKNDFRHCKNLKLKKENIDLVVAGMIKACEPGGTGWPFFDFKVGGKKMKVACKTGTAEVASKEASPHAWFTVFAPSVDPEIVMTILVENGGEGSSEAAPIAKEILTRFFER